MNMFLGPEDHIRDEEHLQQEERPTRDRVTEVIEVVSEKAAETNLLAGLESKSK